MGAISATDIISIIQSEIENFDFDTESRETGEVIYVGDGIATIYGIDHAMYGEIVVFDNGVKGMVQDIRQNEIGVILFGRDHGIHEGTKVVRTKKKAGIPVGEGFIGRIINALGEPIDGKGDIKEEDYRPIENEAPGIVDRKSVDTPLETGILSIDSMFPIGRGQRELIIGDRQTGKTYHHQPEGQGCYLYICSNWPESINSSKNCVNSDKTRRNGLLNRAFINSQRSCITAVYRTIRRNSHGRAFHASGQGCTYRI